MGFNRAAVSTTSRELHPCSFKAALPIACDALNARTVDVKAYLDMTAYENLEVQRLQRGIPGKGCIDNALALVGLKDTGKKKAKDFSLGMRQRLALAIALLGNPEFLVLDEPINGLDPTGIIELRNLLKRLNKERGITILISSHILTELHQLRKWWLLITV